MAQKDVELRIRARDDASKNVKRVSEALKAIETDSAKAAKGADKTSAALGGLAADVAKLKAQATGLSNFARIAEELNKATAASERMQRQLERTNKEFQSSSTQSRAAAQASGELQAKLAEETRALERLRTANAQRKQDLADINKLLKNPKSGATPLTPANTAQLNTRKTSINSDLERDNVAIKAQATIVKELVPVVRASVNESARLSAETERLGNEMLGARVNVLNTKEELLKIDSAAVKASGALGGLSVKQEDVAAASQRLAARLAGSQRALEAFGRISSGGGEVVDPKTAESLQRQVAVINQLRGDWKALEGETKALAKGLQSISGNATEQVDAWQRMAAASRQTKTEYLSQIAVLDQLRAKANLPPSGLAGNKVDAAATAAAAAATSNLANEQTRLAPAKVRTTQAMREQTVEANKLRGALLGIGADSRQTLGFMQRLRGEVLALTTSYIGFQAAIGQVSGGVAAFRTLEAVQNRLGAVFQQNTGRVTAEIDFLRAQADRLGISFAVLGDEYGKFAVAADTANFSVDETRKVFISVAEAARVNKLSTEQMSGVFLALQQMISKGKVSSEELRRQLGDRLTGAFQIFASAVGMTTAELDKAMQSGEVFANRSTLLKFADELTRRFGPQLGASLDSLSTDLGRFENDVFKTQLALAQGFVPALREALQSFNEFANSAEGVETFTRMGEAVGELIGILGQIPKYFDLIVLAAQGLITLKLAGTVLNIAERFGTARAAIAGFASSMTLIGPPTQQMIESQTVLGKGFVQNISRLESYRGALLRSTSANALARVGTTAFATTLGGLRVAMLATAGIARAMWIAIGGLPGLIATGVTLALTSWITSTDGATSALAEHQRQLETVRQGYQLAKGDVKNWANEVKNLTVSQAIANLDQLRASYAKITGAIEAYSRQAVAWNQDIIQAVPDDPRAKQAVQLNQLAKDFRAGKIDVKAFSDALNEIALNPVDEQFKELALGMLGMVNSAKDGEESITGLGDAIKRSEALVRVMQNTATDADKELLGIGETAKDTGKAMDETSQNAEVYASAIEKLKGEIPSLTAEMERLKKMTELNKTAWEGLVAAWKNGDVKAMAQIVSLWGQGASAVATDFNNKTTGSFVDKVVGIESGGNANAKNPNSSATGLGQFIESTWLTMFKKYFPDRAASMTDAAILELRKSGAESKAMIELYAQENAKALQAAGVAVNDANRYLAHFLGPGGAISLLTASPDTPVDQVLSAGQIGANKGVLEGKTAGQVVAWAQQKMGLSEQEQAVLGQINEAENERLKKLQEEATATTKRLADLTFENEQQKLINDGKGKQAAIEAAIREAKAENPNITAAELEALTQQTAALYEKQNAQEGVNKAEERANLLYTLRQQLLEQLKIAQEAGDTGTATSLTARIKDVNVQINDAIGKAIEMWKALGGPEADAAIAKLQTMAASIKDVKLKMDTFGLSGDTWKGIIENGINGLIGIFDTFAQAIANGENAFKAFGQAALGVLAQVIREIAVAIIRMQILKLLSGIGGPIGQVASGMMGHTGGLVGANAIGSGNMIGSAVPWARSAFAYHSGGLVGFAPDEVSATLRKNEEVLTEEDPRHRFNLGGEKAGGTSNGIKQVLAIGDDEIANAMSGRSGEKVVMTILRRNSATVKQMLS